MNWQPSGLSFYLSVNDTAVIGWSFHWPGATTFTLIFFRATSLARERENPTSPSLVALYADWPTLPFKPITLPAGKEENTSKPIGWLSDDSYPIQSPNQEGKPAFFHSLLKWITLTMVLWGVTQTHRQRETGGKWCQATSNGREPCVICYLKGGQRSGTTSAGSHSVMVWRRNVPLGLDIWTLGPSCCLASFRRCGFARNVC